MALERHTRERLVDWYKWFNEHRRYVVKLEDPKKQAEFALKTLDGIFELIALLGQEIERAQNDKPQLLLPTGVKINGDLRKIG